VVDMFSGAHLGLTDAWKASVANADVHLYSVLPYKVAGLAVRPAAQTVPRGGVLRGVITLRKGEGKSARHVFHVQARRPDGRAVRYMRRSIESAAPGAGKRAEASPSAAFELPIAWNEMTGRWTLTVTDVASRTRAKAPFVVR